MLAQFIKKNTNSLLLGSIIMLAALLRFHHVNDNSIMLDEAYSHWFAMLSYNDHWTSATQYGVHPVLYYSVLKFWLSLFGDGHIALRSFSAVASLLTLPFIFIFGRNIGGPKIGAQIGLLASLFFAISPLQLEWSQIARPYTLMTLAIAMSCAGFSWYLRHNNTEQAGIRPSGSKWLADICLVIGSSLALWSHNMSVIFILSMGLYLLWWYSVERSLSSKTALHLIFLALISFLLWSPHAYWLINQTSIVTDNIFYVLPMTIASFGKQLIEIFGTGPPLALASFILLLPLCHIGLKHCTSTVGKKQSYLLLYLLLAPFIVEILLDKLFMPLMVSKTHIWATIPFFVAIAFGIISITKPAIRNSITGIIVVASLAGSMNIPYLHSESNWRSLVVKTLINDKKSPMIIYPNELALPFIYEAKYLGVSTEEIQKRVIPLPKAFPALGLDRPTMAGVPVVLKTDVPLVLKQIDNAPEFWIVAKFHPFFDPERAFLTELLKTHKIIQNLDQSIKVRRLDVVENETEETN